MKYTLVTGFYPSRETAEKVLKKVRANCKYAKIESYEDCYIVILYESNNYNEIDNKFSEYMRKKIYCGIMVNEQKL